MSFDPKQLALFSKKCGVYLMRDKKGQVIYVGKAKNLKERLKQYFAKKGDGRAQIPYLVEKIDAIETIVVDSEKEALLLENTLIKKHKPKYNALLKDDKTYFSLTINHKHAWPMVKVARFKGRPPKELLSFGPYTDGKAARETLKLIRELFPLRQCSDFELVGRKRPCILYDLKRCIAPCVSKCTKSEYALLVKEVTEFLSGHDQSVLKQLKKEMAAASQALNYEKAALILKRIRHIETTLEKQKVEKGTREDTDVLALVREKETSCITVMPYREGRLSGTYHTLFRHTAEPNEELLSSFIMQRYFGLERLPKTLLLPIDLENAPLLEALLSEGCSHNVRLVTPQKGEKRALVEMAFQNGKARLTLEQTSIDQKEQTLMSLQEEFALVNFPERIECFDNSNIAGSDPVSGVVVFIHGKKESKEQRHYKIKEAGPSDDYGALREVMIRRYTKAKEKDSLPDLLVVDGARGHLNLALNVLTELDISTVDVIAVAKEESKHTKGITLERVFLPNKEFPIHFKPNSPLLFLLQQIRDEAHRVAISFQKVRRKKRTFKSGLDGVAGIGPTKKKRLLTHFGSLKRLLAATDQELIAVPGITKKDVTNLRALAKRSV